MTVDVLREGVYTTQQAAVYLREETATVRRWAFGYTRRRNGKITAYPPLINTSLPVLDGRRAMTFVELVELLYVRGFRRAGASWPLIHSAARTAARIFRTEHPFAMKRFFADPDGIYALLHDPRGGELLVELVGHGQHTLRDLIGPYLGQLDFDPADVARRWWPMGRDGRVVLDPTVARGAPIVAEIGVPARALVEAYEAERLQGHDRALEIVSWMFRIQPRHIDDAIRFKKWLQAA